MPDDNRDDQDMMEIDFSEMSLGHRGKARTSSRSLHSRGKLKLLLLSLAGAGLLLFIFLMVFAFIIGNGSLQNPLPLLEARIKTLEEHVARLDGMRDELSSVKQQQEALNQFVSETGSSLKSLERKMNHINQDVARLNSRMGITPALIKSTASIRRDLIRETLSNYHVVRKGESLSGIAKKYGQSLKEIYRLNGLTSNSVIHPGQKIMVFPDSNR